YWVSAIGKFIPKSGAECRSEHWFGKMSSTARKAKKKNIEGSGLGGPLPSYSVGELPDTNSAHASIIGRR
ncbi:hypothetical protein, partial [Aeromonas caviae]|uniref:hypothetical protein n=1 Tax=Aeromonas caviae TaxID=648 RepID=UPI002B4A6977